jgi:hypothetical protein
MATVAVMLGVLVIGYYATQELRHKRAVRRVIALDRSFRNIKEIADAVKAYNDFHEVEAAASLLDTTNGGEGWRVRVLPFIRAASAEPANDPRRAAFNSVVPAKTPPVFASPFRRIHPETGLTSIFLVHLSREQMQDIEAPVVDEEGALVVVDSPTCTEQWNQLGVDVSGENELRQIIDGGPRITIFANLHGNAWTTPNKHVLDAND